MITKGELVQTMKTSISEILRNPPKHDYWRPGEAGCPPDLKAANGELHTLRCKRCGEEGSRNQICIAAVEVANAAAP